jgi:alcohol dehydrogenase class IV
VIFPHTLAFNAPVEVDKTTEIATLMGFGDDLLESAYRYCADLGIEMQISKLGVPAGDLQSMADEAHGIRRLLDFNPREMSPAEIFGLYRAAY